MFETTIILADDHGIVRKGLRFVLESEPGSGCGRRGIEWP